MHFGHFARLAAATAFLVLAASSAGARPLARAAESYTFTQFGWTGTFNVVQERHYADESLRIDIKAARAVQVEEDGSVVVTGGYRGTRTETQLGICRIGNSQSVVPVITTETSEGTLDERRIVEVSGRGAREGEIVVSQSSRGRPGGTFTVRPGGTFTVTETTTMTSPTCPSFVPTTSRRTREVEVGALFIEGALADPAVPHLVGSRTVTNPDGWTITKKWDLKGCGEELGKHWVKRFPSDDSLDALEEPFRTKVRRFVAALREAGARVDVINVYRPPARAYLMNHAWRIAYGRNKPGYTHEEPDKVPAYKGSDDEKVPICWTFRDRDGDYSRKDSIQLAGYMVEGYGIFVAHGAAYPTNHSSRLAIDMNISWNGVLRVKRGPEGLQYRSSVAEISDSGPYWIDKPTGQVKYYDRPQGATLRNDEDMNRSLWQLGRSYGVLKYVNAATPDPPHWSATGT